MSDLETIIRNPKEFGDSLFDLKNKKKYCDAEIIVNTERIPVHKNVLASSSAYFDTIFSDNESKAEVRMENMDLETVKSSIEYCYTGIMRVSEKNLNEIILLAIFLKMTPIIEGCENIFKKRMDFSNCISKWKLAKSDNLKSIAFEYARQNYEKVSQSLEFLDLNDSEISELLNSDIIVANETIVFNSVKKWISHDSASRKQHLDNLLKYVRFEYLPGYISSGSQFQSFCNDNSSTGCLNKILNARRWKDEKKLMPFDGNQRNSYDINTLTVVGSELYGISKTMEIFDLRNEKWINVKNFECDRILFSAVLLENKLMLIGGITNSDMCVNTVQSYDLSTGTMENLPPMKYKRNDLSTVEFKGRVYAIGGFDKTVLAHVEMWDLISRKWNELTPMPTPRSGCEARALNEEVFVVGGAKDEKNYLSDAESYNPVTDKWKKCASMNEERYAPGVTVIGSYLYVAGGMMSGDVYLNTVERYDHTIDKWNMIHPLQNINAWMGSGNLFGKFVIVGGSSSDEKNWSTMEMYDDENDYWISMPSLNGPRRMLRAIEIPWPLARAILSREDPK